MPPTLEAKLRDSSTLQASEVPFRMPSFVKLTALNNHHFEIGGEEWEYIDGMYFKKISVLETGSSFGEIALQRKCTRTATIKTESNCQFAYMTKSGY